MLEAITIIIIGSAINPIFWLAIVSLFFGFAKWFNKRSRGSFLLTGFLLMLVHCIALMGAIGHKV